MRQPEPEIDGRRLRRQRNREAVVDAVLELYREGNLRPNSAQIAERAGLSPRSIFRYFDDVGDLCRAAFTRQEERGASLLGLEAQAETDEPLSRRLRLLVEQRVHHYDAIAPAATAARAEAPFQPLLAAELRRSREAQRAQLAAFFAPELDGRGGRAPTDLAIVDVLCSFESHQLLRHEHGLSAEETVEALCLALEVLLA